MELTPAQIRFLKSSIKHFRLQEWKVDLAGQAASARRFFRVSRLDKDAPVGINAKDTLKDLVSGSYILVEWDSKDDDWPRFLDIAAYASPMVDFLPKIYASDPAHGLILEEDLGDTTLKLYCFDNLEIECKYREVIDALCAWQRLDVSKCPAIVSRSLDFEQFMWESAYFAEHCVTEYFARENLLSPRWKKERETMAEYTASIPQLCVHRDFQSENILIHNKRHIRIVDFQGARLGPPHYDAASLLFDPYVNMGYWTIDALRDYYLEKMGLWAESEERNFNICAAQRLMQALGAFCNLTLHKGKPRYRQFIPIALKKLYYVLKYLPDYPAMREVVNVCLDICNRPGFPSFRV